MRKPVPVPYAGEREPTLPIPITVRRALVSGGVPSILEPVGVCREDAKRPDGMTLIPWEDGRPLLWDFTSCNTLAQSHRARAERGPGVVANFAEDQKCRKYASLTPSYIFAPVCIESLGAWGDNACPYPGGVRRVRTNPPPATGKGPLLHSLVVVYHSCTLHGIHA